MIPNQDLEKFVKPDLETVIPVWEHMKIKIFDSERGTFEEDPESCNLKKSGRKDVEI